MKMTSEEWRRRNKELFERLKDGDESAKDELLEINARVITHIIKKLPEPTWNCTRDDIFDAGSIGLLKAIETFDIDKGFAFATYASRCIQNEILMLYRKQKKHKGVASLDAVMTDFNGKSDNDKLTLGKMLADPRDWEEKIESKSVLDSLKKLAQLKLTPIERQVITLRYLSGEDLTQKEVAGRLGFVPSYVSRIEASAIKKLRDGYNELEEKAERGELVAVAGAGIAVAKLSKKEFASKLRKDKEIQQALKILIPQVLTKTERRVFEAFYLKTSPISAKRLAKKLQMTRGAFNTQKSKSFNKIYNAYCDDQIGIMPQKTGKADAYAKYNEFRYRLQHEPETLEMVKSLVPLVLSKSRAKVFTAMYLNGTKTSKTELATQLDMKENAFTIYESQAIKALLAAYEAHGKGQPVEKVRKRRLSGVDVLLKNEESLKIIKLLIPDVLSDTQQKVFEYTYLSMPPKSAEELAEELDASIGSIYNAAHNARIKLLAAFEDYKNEKNGVEGKTKGEGREEKFSTKRLNREFRREMSSDTEVLGFVKTNASKLLPKRHAQVIECRYLTVPPMTVAETAEKLNLTYKAISVFDSTGIAMLRQAYEGQENKKENE